MLSAALVVFALYRPAPAPVVQIAPAGVRTVAAASDSEIQARIDAAVAKSIGEVEARQVLKTNQLVADLEQARHRLLMAAEEYDQSQRRSGAGKLLAGFYAPPPEHGDPR
jgi:hypothetical protein